MEEALAGHEATLSALNSMSCAMVSKYKNANAEGEIAAKYFRDGSRVRTEYLDHGRRNISVRGPDGVLYSFGLRRRVRSVPNLSLLGAMAAGACDSRCRRTGGHARLNSLPIRRHAAGPQLGSQPAELHPQHVGVGP